MCDDSTVAEDEEFLRNKSGLSRRGFGAASVGALSAGALAACATSADAQAVTETDVNITTPDGTCDAHFAHPASGRHPAVLVWPDIMGLRPAFRVMGKRLAQSGYAVLTVNPFYRLQRAPILQEGQTFQDPDVRQRLMGLTRGFSHQTRSSDATALINWLDAQGAVDTGKKIGTTGYCLGGSFVMSTAVARADRVGAGGTFHGGGLATANPDSPHLMIPQMRASFLIAVAQNDDEREPQTKETLRQAFAAASRPAEIEVYPAQHGWCVIDSQVYNEAQAERAWARLLHLFQTSLR
jgi:carboxymethylenebutenolidase